MAPKNTLHKTEGENCTIKRAKHYYVLLDYNNHIKRLSILAPIFKMLLNPLNIELILSNDMLKCCVYSLLLLVMMFV